MTEKERILKKAIELNEEKKYQEVDDLLTDEILQKYSDANFYAEKAQALYMLKRQNEFIKNVNYGFEIDSENAKINYCLGIINFEDNDYDKAIEFYLKSIKIDPSYYRPYSGLGNLYKYLDRYEEAKKFYLKSIEINPNNFNGLSGLANIHRILKENDIAKQYFLKIIKINPENLNAHIELGNIFYESKEYNKSEEYYLKAIKIDSEYPFSYNGLGNIAFDLKKYEKAEQYYLEALKKGPKNSAIYFNIAQLYFKLEKFEKAKFYYNERIKFDNDNTNYFYKTAISKIEEIDKILESSSYKTISNLIAQIKKILLFKGEYISHYTGISTVQILVLNNSALRLSEGSFLNDTSEGEELFKFLNKFLTESEKKNNQIFTKRPFIGSFVDADKNNDLTLWRMYGKENLEEAKGCSITINSQVLKNDIKNKINHDKELSSTRIDDIEFYRVAYRSDSNFEFAGATILTNKRLTSLMDKLKKEIESFTKQKVKRINEEVEIIELLNSIAYLFKSVEYKYENEVRLVINEAIGFEKMIDFDKDNFKPSENPNKVYIELVPIASLLKTITIGPKVAKSEEWAATFHYHLANNNYKPEIFISKIPFK